VNATLSEGYTSIAEAFTVAVGRFEQENSGPQKSGSCARVVIRIEQELVLTRSAFLATLEIFNEGIAMIRYH
jgi:hypothetical protein